MAAPHPPAGRPGRRLPGRRQAAAHPGDAGAPRAPHRNPRPARVTGSPVPVGGPGADPTPRGRGFHAGRRPVPAGAPDSIQASRPGRRPRPAPCDPQPRRSASWQVSAAPPGPLRAPSRCPGAARLRVHPHRSRPARTPDRVPPRRRGRPNVAGSRPAGAPHRLRVARSPGPGGRSTGGTVARGNPAERAAGPMATERGSRVRHQPGTTRTAGPGRGPAHQRV